MVRENNICKVLITGASGLLGFHARAAILADNCAAAFNGKACKYELIELPRLTEETIGIWSSSIVSASLVLHLAGINRGDASDVEMGNPNVARLLVSVLENTHARPHVIFSNSTHAGSDSPYGRGKDAANKLLLDWAKSAKATYTNIVLPHIFGEKARPHYNNVTATLCRQVVDDEEPTIHDGAQVELLHAGAAVDAMFDAYETQLSGRVRLAGKVVTVQELYRMLLGFREVYNSNTYPDLSDPFVGTLFNCYRSVDYPSAFPRKLQMHVDNRGALFEAVKGGGGGQSFLSWTKPGIERGNHFHRRKIERFLVVSGSAEIRMRSIFDDRVDTYQVSGDEPAYVDMPTLYTHSIVNVGTEPLLTLFWTHEIFDPSNPDTYAHPVTVE